MECRQGEEGADIEAAFAALELASQNLAAARRCLENRAALPRCGQQLAFLQVSACSFCNDVAQFAALVQVRLGEDGGFGAAASGYRERSGNSNVRRSGSQDSPLIPPHPPPTSGRPIERSTSESRVMPDYLDAEVESSGHGDNGSVDCDCSAKSAHEPFGAYPSSQHRAQEFDPWSGCPDNLHQSAAATGSESSSGNSNSEKTTFTFRSAHATFDPSSARLPTTRKQATSDINFAPDGPTSTPNMEYVQRRLKAWASEEANGTTTTTIKPIRALLTTMHEVLPPQLGFSSRWPGIRMSGCSTVVGGNSAECDDTAAAAEAAHWARWTPVTLAECLNPRDVKRLVNTKARLVVAPDKLPKGVAPGAAVVCAELYRVINVAYSEFRIRELPPGAP